MAPTYANGKICYLEIPTTDLARSVKFYQAAFGWHVRKRGDGSTAFDDGVGEVSGAWATGRPSSATPGLLLVTDRRRNLFCGHALRGRRQTERVDSVADCPCTLGALGT